MIRHAIPCDIACLVALGAEFCAIHPLATLLGFDAQSLADTLAGLIDHPSACVVVEVDGDRMQGCLVGMVAPLFFQADALVAYEIAWFVTAAGRQQGTGKALCRAFEWWAAGRGAHAVVMTAIHAGVPVGPFYEHQGYTAYETNYVKGL